MTKQQIFALVKAIENTRGVTVGGMELSIGTGEVKVEKPGLPIGEVNRRFASEDYRLGYETAHKMMEERILFIIKATNEELVKYAGRWSSRPVKKNQYPRRYK